MQSKTIRYLDLSIDYQKNKKKYLNIFDDILSSGAYVPNKNIELLEKKITNFLKVKYCASLNSGTDALFLAFYCLNLKKGSEVITTPNTWYSSIGAIIHNGLIPKFIDIKFDQNFNEDLIESKITKKTKAILAVHLNGKMTNIIKIKKICKRYNLKLIEDAAQAFGSQYNKINPGQKSDIACFSTHPTKTLFSFRDGGFVVSNNKNLINRIKVLRNHGVSNSKRDECVEFGFNSRIDGLQAKILMEKLKEINLKVKNRNVNAKLYLNHLDRNYFQFDKPNIECKNSYQFFFVLAKKRDKLFKYLSSKGISVSKYFHIPIYKQKAYLKIFKKKINLKNSNYMEKRVINLPIRESLKKTEILYICKLMNKFFKKK